MKFQVGSLRDFKSDDPLFEDKFQAFDYAMVTSEDEDDEIGVWAEGDELIAIAYQGDLFRLNFFDFDIQMPLLTSIPVVVDERLERGTIKLVNPDGTVAGLITNVGLDG